MTWESIVWCIIKILCREGHAEVELENAFYFLVIHTDSALIYQFSGIYLLGGPPQYFTLPKKGKYVV